MIGCSFRDCLANAISRSENVRPMLIAKMMKPSTPRNSMKAILRSTVDVGAAT